jgi:plasmid stabilization system protein ParE
MKVRFTLRATHDLAAIGDYLRERNPAAAAKVRAAILRSLETLAMFPRLGRRQTVEGVRKIVARRYPYLVYYTVDASNAEIVILSIQHPSRKREFENA